MADERLAELESALQDATSGESLHADRLLSILYDDLRSIARGMLRREQVGQTLQATALVHEAYLRLIRCSGGWESEEHFINAAALVMRNIMIDRFKRKQRIVHGGGRKAQQIEFTELKDDSTVDAVDLIELNMATLALEAHDARKAKVVSLRFFGGLSEEQVAELLHVNVRTVRRDWTYARLWLARRMEGRPDRDSTFGDSGGDTSGKR